MMLELPNAHDCTDDKDADDVAAPAPAPPPKSSSATMTSAKLALIVKPHDVAMPCAQFFEMTCHKH